jgi:hypothetical protein
MAKRKRTTGERLAISEAQARGGPDRPVEGIDERTSHINPDSAVDTRRPPASGLGGSEQGGMAGPVGYFEGEGNEGPFAPLGGDPTKSADDVEPHHQGGAASGAPDTLASGRS